MDEEARRDRSLAERPGELAGLLRTQPPLGFAVEPARCTRRLPSSMKKSTYSRYLDQLDLSGKYVFGGDQPFRYETVRRSRGETMEGGGSRARDAA
jgi:hypothetical protein